MTRRHFIAGAAATATMHTTVWSVLEKLSPTDAGAQDERFWSEVRKQFQFQDRLVSFNHVGLAPPPRAVREAQERQFRRASTIPTQVIWREQIKEIEDVRARLARLIGAKPEEVAITPNATYGLQTGILGWPMSKGDAIITTNHDYSRTFTAIQHRRRRDGIELIEVPIGWPPASPQKVIADFKKALKPNVKLAVICTMTFLNGHILPVKEIIQLCHERGIAVLIDGAQSIALKPTQFSGWNADMYTACLHKWLMAPVGTGVFAVKTSKIEQVWSMCPSDESLGRDIRKYEQIGTRPLAPILAINQALDFHEWLGMDMKHQRIQYLRMRLAERVLNLDKVVHYGSIDPDRAAAMLTIGFQNMSATEASNALASRFGYHVTTATRAGMEGIRISPNVFTSPAEIDGLAEAISELSRT